MHTGGYGAQNVFVATVHGCQILNTYPVDLQEQAVQTVLAQLCVEWAVGG